MYPIKDRGPVPLSAASPQPSVSCATGNSDLLCAGQSHFPGVAVRLPVQRPSPTLPPPRRVRGGPWRLGGSAARCSAERGASRRAAPSSHGGDRPARHTEAAQAAGIRPQVHRDRDASGHDAGGAAGQRRPSHELPQDVGGGGHAGPRRVPGLPHHQPRAAHRLRAGRGRPAAPQDGVHLQLPGRAAAAGGRGRGRGLLAQRGDGAGARAAAHVGAAAGAGGGRGRGAHRGPLPRLPVAAHRAPLPAGRLLRLPHGAQQRLTAERRDARCDTGGDA